MRTTLCVRAGWLVGALGASLLIGGVASAQLTMSTERPGSLLIFPKVTCSGQRETVIQVANTGNMPNTVHCFYLNGAPGRNGRPVCTSSDFWLNLTKQQPTHWHACTGRPAVASGVPTTSTIDGFSDSSGLSPGLIPAVQSGFAGALVCAETDEDGVPMVMNALKGEATIEGPGPDVATYNGIAFTGKNPATSDLNLSLDGSTEYAACPASARLNFIPAGQTDPVIENLGNGGRCIDDPNLGCGNGAPCPTGGCQTGLSSVANNVTVLPCNLDFSGGGASHVALHFSGTNEFEQTFSGDTTISCWGTFTLAPPTIDAVSTQYATVQITATSGGPFVAVGEEFHTDAVGNSSSAAVNLFTEGAGPTATIRLY
jgi:hypothetical protein